VHVGDEHQAQRRLRGLVVLDLRLQGRLDAHDRAEDVEGLGPLRVVGAELVGEQLGCGQRAGEPGLADPVGVVGHDAVRGDGEGDQAGGGQLPGPEPQFGRAARLAPQVAQRHVDRGGGGQPDNDPEQERDHQPRGDAGHLLGDVGLEPRHEAGHVAVGQPGELQDVDVLGGDVHADGQPDEVRELPAAQRGVRGEGRAVQEGAPHLERDALHGGVVREGLQGGRRAEQGEGQPQHPAHHPLRAGAQGGCQAAGAVPGVPPGRLGGVEGQLQLLAHVLALVHRS
jgi:hypothetical protein